MFLVSFQSQKELQVLCQNVICLLYNYQTDELWTFVYHVMNIIVLVAQLDPIT